MNYLFWTFQKFSALWTEIALKLFFLHLLRSLLALQLFLMFDVFKSLVHWEFPFICKWWTFPEMLSQPFQCFQRFLTVPQFVCPSRYGCDSVFSCLCLKPVSCLYTSSYFNSLFPSSFWSVPFWTTFLSVGCLRKCH